MEKSLLGYCSYNDFKYRRKRFWLKKIPIKKQDTFFTEKCFELKGVVIEAIKILSDDEKAEKNYDQLSRIVFIPYI